MQNTAATIELNFESIAEYLAVWCATPYAAVLRLDDDAVTIARRLFAYLDQVSAEHGLPMRKHVTLSAYVYDPRSGRKASGGALQRRVTRAEVA